MTPPERKVTKKAAEYGKGMAKAHCDICRHFAAPNHCSVVIGKVGARGWCKYFEKAA